MLTVSTITPFFESFVSFIYPHCSLLPYLVSDVSSIMTFSIPIMLIIVSLSVLTSSIYRRSCLCRILSRGSYVNERFSSCYAGYEAIATLATFLAIGHASPLRWG